MRNVSPARLLAATLALAASCAAQAQAQPAPGSDEALREFATREAAALYPQATRSQVQVGYLDRASLAPCRRVETFLPPGAKLWGRSSLGLRCTDGASWSVLAPVTVRLWGQALVAVMPLAAGSVPGPQDLREQEVELTREGPSVLRDPAQLGGRTLARPLAAGQAVRADMLRAAQVVQAGDPVRLRIQGQGFVLSATGQALAAAAEGQPVRVRTDLGRVLSGIAREGRAVDVAL